MKEIENRLDKMSDENDKFKKIVAEKELELAILRDLRDKVNPDSLQSSDCNKADK